MSLKPRRYCVYLSKHTTMPKQSQQTNALCKKTVSPFKIITFLPIQKSAWNSLRLQWLRKREYKKINIHVMPFKSLINIRSICPLAEIQRPVNANEWERKAIRVHYRVPLVSRAASLRLSTGRPRKRQTHNSKILCTLNDRWDTCAFCVLRERRMNKNWLQKCKCFPFLEGQHCYSLIHFEDIYWEEAIINSDEVG